MVGMMRWISIIHLLQQIDAILNNVSFQGVSSWIEFRTSGDQQVSNPVRISQVDQSNATTITLYNKSNLTYPADVFISDEFRAVNVLLHPFLITIGFTSAFFLFVFIAVVQVTSVIYRNHPYVKASSPMLNHFIFLGCYLFMVAVISYYHSTNQTRSNCQGINFMQPGPLLQSSCILFYHFNSTR